MSLKIRKENLETRIPSNFYRRNLSSHFEYLGNRFRGPNVTWNQDTFLHMHEQRLSSGVTQAACETLPSVFVYYVIV